MVGNTPSRRPLQIQTFKLTQTIEADKPTTISIAQRQEDVHPHVVMDVLPFQRAWGKSKNCQSPWLSEKVWILVERR